jgi:23S rRNA C2498 (ribose-2'-O)-methylase RlmM
LRLIVDQLAKCKIVGILTESTTSPFASTLTTARLIRISKNFEHFADDIIVDLGVTLTKRLGQEYYLVRYQNPQAKTVSDAERYIRWNLTMDHAWPCRPEKMEDFIEKAAQALFQKFGGQNLQGVFIGILDASSTHNPYKTLASNLRGRTLQLFGRELSAFQEVEEQDPRALSLFCLVGKEGLYCGVCSPLQANGFYPGGTKFISQKAPHTISRAGAKIAEALHYLKLHQPLPAKGSHWLELGASPGGMTSELLERGYQVTAIDRAPLDERLKGRKGLSFKKADVARYNPVPNSQFDSLLCDMNGDVQTSLKQVVRLSESLIPGGLILFTLKTPGATSFKECNSLYHEAIKSATAGGLEQITCTHLTYNRLEFTLLLKKTN